MHINKDYHPLVSCRILTYNSARFVLDALESIKSQTYDNIELVVSDDCSKDNTVQIVQEWIEKNKSRFVNATLITSPVNTGTSANGNRCTNACKGEWMKGVAGDDALCPDCVESFVNYVIEHPEQKWIASPIKQYLNTFEEENAVEFNSEVWNKMERYEWDAEKQLKYMARGNYISAPSCFFNMGMVREMGGYDEKYGILEDHPFYMKLLEHGYKCYMMPKTVVKQRISGANVCSNHTSRLFNWRLRQMDYLVTRDMCFKYFSWREKVKYRNRHIIDYMFNALGINDKKYIKLYTGIKKCANLWVSDKIWGETKIE